MNSFVRIGIDPSNISEFRTHTTPQKTADASKEGASTSPGLKLQMALREKAASIADKILIRSLTTRSLSVLRILSEPGYDPLEVWPSTRRLSLSLATIDEYHAARFVGTYITDRATKLNMESSIDEYLQPTKSMAEEMNGTFNMGIMDGKWEGFYDNGNQKFIANYKNGINAVKKIKFPTLFVFGELDKMIKLDKGKQFSALIPGSKTHIIKDCGHMIILENAFEMREKVAEFLKS